MKFGGQKYGEHVVKIKKTIVNIFFKKEKKYWCKEPRENISTLFNLLFLRFFKLQNSYTDKRNICHP